MLLLKVTISPFFYDIARVGGLLIKYIMHQYGSTILNLKNNNHSSSPCLKWKFCDNLPTLVELNDQIYLIAVKRTF